MSGDGMAWAIVLAMALMILCGILLGVLVSRTVARRWVGTNRSVAGLVFGAIGLGAGLLAVTATFYESTWSPPPQMTFNTPQGFSKAWVIALEDPAATAELVWKGWEMPFRGKTTVVSVPPSGVVRVRSLAGVSGRVDTTVLWSDGSRNTGQGGGPAPKSTRAVSFSAYNRVGTDSLTQADPPFGDSDALGAYIALLEREAR